MPCLRTHAERLVPSQSRTPGGHTATSSESSWKRFSNAAGLMISIMRAGTSPAFHICVHFHARLGDVPTGGEYGLTIARSKADLSLRED